MTEAAFKRRFFQRLRDRFPGCEIVRTDSSSQQGMLDHVVLFGPYWAALEFKKSPLARRQPNQEFYVKRLDRMGYAAFVYPENEDEVLDALEQAFTPPRRARVS